MCLCACYGWKDLLGGGGGGYTKEDGIWKTQVQFVVEREAKRTGHTALKQEYKVYGSTSLEPLSLSMYSPVHIHLRGSTLRTRSKANNFIGGLHNSAPIPGVIVFPLRLSCRDESLMHSFRGIMDGTGQLQPGPAAGDGSEGGMNGDTACTYRPQAETEDSSVCMCVCGICPCIYIYL